MRLLPFATAALLLAAFTGCGTVLSTPLQKVKVSSRPTGAQVRVDGSAQGYTPTTVELTRWQDHEITLELRGFQPYRLHLSRRVNPWIAGNILNIFPVGVIVDASTGAIYKLDPPEVQVDLFPRGIRRRPLEPGHGHGHGHAKARAPFTGQEIAVATTTEAKPHWRKIGQMERL